ncbi:MAG TPA: D-alanine--D-alanine ligase A, partial [Pseudonocardiaceae bacterium]
RVDSSLPAEIRATENSDDTEFDIPAKLPDAVTAGVRELAVRAFRALNCQGLARVDFRVGPDDTVTVDGVNTMPGFDPVSLYPKMWAVTGVDGPTLLTTLVDTAMARGTGLR